MAGFILNQCLNNEESLFEIMTIEVLGISFISVFYRMSSLTVSLLGLKRKWILD